MVIDMEAAFSDLYEMTELNLCSFDTRSVTTVKNMFVRSSKLTKIRVSDEWDISSANKFNMYWSAGVSNVTTGEC